jgi:hypothetical protein
MGASDYLQKALLDWCLQGATPTRASALWLDMVTSSPNVTSAFSGGAFFSRVTVTFAAANSPNTSATLLGAFTGTNTAAATFVGFNLYDHSTGGNRLFWGTMTAAIGCNSADNPACAAGGLIIVLS